MHYYEYLNLLLSWKKGDKQQDKFHQFKIMMLNDEGGINVTNHNNTTGNTQLDQAIKIL